MLVNDHSMVVNRFTQGQPHPHSSASRLLSAGRVYNFGYSVPQIVGAIWLLQCWMTDIGLAQAGSAVPGHEEEGDIPAFERRRNGIHLGAIEVNVENGEVYRFALGHLDRRIEARNRSDYAVPKFLQYALKEERDQHLVFDHKDAQGGGVFI